MAKPIAALVLLFLVAITNQLAGQTSLDSREVLVEKFRRSQDALKESERLRKSFKQRWSEYVRETRELKKKIAALNNYIMRQGFLPASAKIDFPVQPLAQDMGISQNPINRKLPNTTPVPAAVARSTETTIRPDYQNMIRKLRSELRLVRERIVALERSYEEKIVEIRADHVTEMNEINSRLKKAEEGIAELEVELTLANEILDCLRFSEKEKRTAIRNAQPALDSARQRFKQYSRLASSSRRDRASQQQIAEHLDYIFNTYNQYDNRATTTTCGDLEISSVIEFTQVGDHLNMAYILAKDPRHLVNNKRYGDSTDQRAARVNTDIIYHIGQIYAKQNKYNDRAEANKIVSEDLMELLNILPAALMSSENINTSDTTSRTNFVKQLYASIPKLYEQERYISAIGIYNRFQRIEGESGLRNEQLIRASVRFAIGTILLYDLGNVSNLQGIALSGTWLKESLPEMQNKGADLLKGVISMSAREERDKKELNKIKYRAAYMLSKRYEPENRAERAVRKSERRIRKNRTK